MRTQPTTPAFPLWNPTPGSIAHDVAYGVRHLGASLSVLHFRFLERMWSGGAPCASPLCQEERNAAAFYDGTVAMALMGLVEPVGCRR